MWTPVSSNIGHGSRPVDNSLTANHTSPPHYGSIPRAVPAFSGVDTSGLGHQASRNQEKQALRDAWSREDLARRRLHAEPERDRTTSGRAEASFHLPAGMDVSEALSKCDDPTLGWSMTFWVTIADPVVRGLTFCADGSVSARVLRVSSLWSLQLGSTRWSLRCAPELRWRMVGIG